MHFWDGMDFDDSTALADTAFIEESFANFASVMPHASVAGRNAAVERLMEVAKASVAAPAMFMEVAERYLYEPQSPVYCEVCFEPFARYAVANAIGAERVQLLLDDMAQNAPGTSAPDLQLLMPNATATTLHRLLASNVPTLLLFYDSDCAGCRHLIATLDGDEGFRRMVEQRRLRVVAVNLAEESESIGKGSMNERKEADNDVFPAAWTGATARDAEEVRDVYALRHTPTLYLIDSDGRVILKNATLPLLATHLSH